MIPGEWVRRIVTAPAAAHVPHIEAPRTTGTTDPSRPPSRRAFPWGPWPRWVGIAIFVALMLGCTLLAMWGASRSDALRHARTNTIGAIVPQGKPMPNMNPGRELTCPRCPKQLRYITTRSTDGYVHQKSDKFKTTADTHVYECASHGRFHVGPNGRLLTGG